MERSKAPTALSSSERTPNHKSLVLIVGTKKVTVDLDSASGDLDLDRLSQAVQSETQVEPVCQKLIFKGRTLFKQEDVGTQVMKTSLDTVGLKNGDRVMVLGRKKPPGDTTPSDANKLSSLQDKLSPLTSLADQVDSLCGRLEDTLRPLADSQDVPSLKCCKKCLMGLHEESMRLLESVDSTPAATEDNRKHRKSLVNKLQNNLDKCEEHLDKVKTMLKNLEKRDHRS